MGVSPKGRDWGPSFNWDDLAKAYAAILIAWTVILASGIVWLVCNRRLPFVRMRNLPLIISSTCLLHVYYAKILLAYMVNGNFNCGAEFWIMSIYLPFGIALFQANVMQLRNVSLQQKRLLERQTSWTSSSSAETNEKRKVRRWRDLTVSQRGYVYIGIGMLVQLIVTTALYSSSPVLLGDWSSFGPLTFDKGQAKCRKTLHWIPSAFWQLFCSWIWGPYVLFKVRKVRDAHHWRLQVLLTVLAGLPGSPMWLAAVYTQSSAFANVNKYFVPPMWLAPGLMVMQFVTIFFPIYEFFEERKAVKGISQFVQSASKYSDDLSSRRSIGHAWNQENLAASTSKLFAELAVSGAGEGRSMYRIAALERALVINPLPLLSFAANRDFTAENIIFLINVRAWRKAWQDAPRVSEHGGVMPFAQMELLKWAIEIYMTSMCERTAEISINVAPSVSKGVQAKLGLDPMAKPARPVLRSTASDDRPCDDLKSTPHVSQEVHAGGRQGSWVEPKVPRVQVDILSLSELVTSSPKVWAQNLPSPTFEDDTFEDTTIAAVLPDGIPLGFDEHIFDAAESSIMVLVLLNTWRKFVKEQNDKMNAKSEV